MGKETEALFIIPQAHILLGLAETTYSEMFNVKPYVMSVSQVPHLENTNRPSTYSASDL